LHWLDFTVIGVYMLGDGIYLSSVYYVAKPASNRRFDRLSRLEATLGVKF